MNSLILVLEGATFLETRGQLSNRVIRHLPTWTGMTQLLLINWNFKLSRAAFYSCTHKLYVLTARWLSTAMSLLMTKLEQSPRTGRTENRFELCGAARVENTVNTPPRKEIDTMESTRYDWKTTWSLCKGCCCQLRSGAKGLNWTRKPCNWWYW